MADDEGRSDDEELKKEPMADIATCQISRRLWRSLLALGWGRGYFVFSLESINLT